MTNKTQYRASYGPGRLSPNDEEPRRRESERRSLSAAAATAATMGAAIAIVRLCAGRDLQSELPTTPTLLS